MIPHQQSDDLQRSREAFLQLLRRALVVRHAQVVIGDVVARFQRAGDIFEDGGNSMKALETGIYLKLPRFLNGERADGRWLYHGPSDDLEDIVAPYIAHMSAHDFDALRVGIIAGTVLRDKATQPPQRTTGEAPAPSSPARRMGLR